MHHLQVLTTKLSLCSSQFPWLLMIPRRFCGRSDFIQNGRRDPMKSRVDWKVNNVTLPFHHWCEGVVSLWRHQMVTFSALLALCAGNSPVVTGEFPTQRPVARSFDVFFDLRLNKRLSKQSRGWWFETPSWSVWRHCNVGKCVITGCGESCCYYWRLLVQQSPPIPLMTLQLSRRIFSLTAYISRHRRINGTTNTTDILQRPFLLKRLL